MPPPTRRGTLHYFRLSERHIGCLILLIQLLQLSVGRLRDLAGRRIDEHLKATSRDGLIHHLTAVTADAGLLCRLLPVRLSRRARFLGGLTRRGAPGPRGWLVGV